MKYLFILMCILYTLSNVIVIEAADDFTVSITTNVRTEVVILNCQIVGNPSNTVHFSIYKNGVEWTPVGGTPDTSFMINQLQPGANYTFQVDAYTIDNSYRVTYIVKATTYQYVLVPVVTLNDTGYDFITLEFSSQLGVPNDTVYSVNDISQGSVVSGCDKISANRCVIKGLQPGTTYKFGVFAFNDGYETAQSTDSYTTYRYPVVNTFEIDSYTTQAVSFSYSGIYGSPVQSRFFIQVDGNNITDLACRDTNQCYVSGLTPGKNISILVQAENNGAVSAAQTKYVKLYERVSDPSITSLKPRTTKLFVQFSSENGVPDATTYTVKLDHVEVPECRNQTSWSCSVENLIDGKSYQIDIIASNDGYNTSISTVFDTYPLINSPQLNATVRTTQIILDYSVEGGFPSDIIYDIVFNGEIDYSCSNSPDTSCEYSSLTPGTEYNATITATNDFYSITFSKNFTTYDLVSSPKIKLGQSNKNKTYTLYYPADNGVPGESVYNVSINGNPIPECSNTIEVSCLIPDLKLNTKYTFNVTVANDGITATNGLLTSTYDYLTPVAISVKDVSSTSISIEWSKSNGGAPGMTTYTTLYSSNNGSDWTPKCKNVTETSCLFDELKEETQYTLRVVSSNTAFDDTVYADTTASTEDTVNLSTHLTVNFLLLLIVSSLILLFI